MNKRTQTGCAAVSVGSGRGLLACAVAAATLASACSLWDQLEPPPPDAGPSYDAGFPNDGALGSDALSLPDTRTFDASGPDGIDCTETLGGALGCSVASVACDTVKRCPATWDPSQDLETCTPGTAAIMKESCDNTIRWSFFQSSYSFVRCYYDRAGGPLLGVEEQLGQYTHCGTAGGGVAYGTFPVACHDDAGTFISDVACTADGASIVR